MRPFPWQKMRRKTDAELPCEPPLRLGSSRRERKLRRLILETAAHNARRLGMDRRQFLASSMGMATSLWVLNQVTACSRTVVGEGGHGLGDAVADGGHAAGGTTGKDGESGAGTAGRAGGPVPDAGGCAVPYEATFEESCASAILGGSEFIFDVHTSWFSNQDLGDYQQYQLAFGPLFSVATEEAYIDGLFCKSDTTMACLTGWPGILCTETRRISCGMPLSNESIVHSRDRINALAGNTQRVLGHMQIMAQDPSGLDGQLALMEEFVCAHGVGAFKLYPGFKPGFRLTDDVADRVVQRGIELGVPRFCFHKGRPVGNFYEPTVNYPDDVGVVARRYPEASFVVYNAAICSGEDVCTAVEGPYDPDVPRPLGTNALIRSVLDEGIPPGGNVHAEVGWAFNQLKSDPTACAHFFGKLLKYLGEDNVQWGTNSISDGIPQAQIEVFRVLEIPESMQSEYGYPALTPAIKAKIFGLSAARLYGVDPTATRCGIATCPPT